MITQEELNQKPLTTTLVPMFDENRPNVFAFIARFPCGLNQAWAIVGPEHVVDDAWIRGALEKVLEAMIADLREGRSEPIVKRNKQAFRETNWNSMTASVQKLLVDWEERRRAWARAHAAPTVIQ